METRVALNVHYTSAVSRNRGLSASDQCRLDGQLIKGEVLSVESKPD